MSVRQDVIFQALGQQISDHAASDRALKFRLLQAEAVIAKYRRPLKCQKSWDVILSFWCQVVQPSAIFGLGILHLSHDHFMTVKGWENQWLRRLLPLRRKKNADGTLEDMEEYNKKDV